MKSEAKINKETMKNTDTISSVETDDRLERVLLAQ